jgi:heterodisulfide reductase subunit A
MSDRRIGVYICHCGGNISDYVDVEKVKEAVKDEQGVVVAKTAMFTCSDATQQEMIQDIKELGVDGLVVASCSPKLHLHTFRDVAKRAELNPYQYTQINIREQCSWTHTDDHEGATEKAIRLIRGGIARTNKTEPLHSFKIDTVPKVLIVGAGIAGLRAAIGLSDIGISVFLVEKEKKAGGKVAELGEMYSRDKKGAELINQLVKEVKARENVTLFTSAEVIEKAGSVGDFNIKIQIQSELHDESRAEDIIALNVGSVIVATGFDSYQPKDNEYGFDLDRVVTLDEFKKLIDSSGQLMFKDKLVKNIVYVYCVGSRQSSDVENANRYCSRYCCNASVHASITALKNNPQLHQYHLFRDVRTYGKFEPLLTEALRKGSTFLKFDESEPPVIEMGQEDNVIVSVKDLLTFGEEINIKADLVVLAAAWYRKRISNLLIFSSCLWAQTDSSMRYIPNCAR